MQQKINRRTFAFIIGFLSMVFCQMAISEDKATSFEPSANVDYVRKLTRQEFPLFRQIKTTGGSTTVTVSYKDYNGDEHHDGTLEVPADVANQVKGLFADLLADGFLFQQIKPLSQYSDVYTAMKNNATFFFESALGEVWLVINPVNNPLIVRDIGDKAVVHKHTFAHGVATSNKLVIFPAAGVLSVNVNQTGNVGKLTPKALAVFSKYNFIQALQANDNPDVLFFGLLGYQYKAPAMPKKIDFADATLVAPTFSYEPLPDSVKKALIDSGAWKKGCPVNLDRLNYVQFGYYGYDGNIAQGSLVTADVVAPNILEVFKNFFQNKIAIEKPGGEKVGGTGMFNCRKITGESGFSLHSYGTALDLSYYRNPYIGVYKLDKNNDGIAATGVIVIPDSQLIFLARNRHVEGFNEVHVDYLRSQGLSEWGGHWLNRTDYMHFQTSPFFSYLFPLIDAESGKILFTLEKNKDSLLHKFSIQSTEVAKWSLMAQLYPKHFAQAFVKNIAQFDALGEDGFYQMLYTKLQAKMSK
ncbi:MAG: M15 family metallopeptidase [Gammaproteobacteria bacterium]|nr:M15 family metallopeptidase [Gammaproteobacteria bacterium]